MRQLKLIKYQFKDLLFTEEPYMEVKETPLQFEKDSKKSYSLTQNPLQVSYHTLLSREKVHETKKQNGSSKIHFLILNQSREITV